MKKKLASMFQWHDFRLIFIYSNLVSWKSKLIIDFVVMEIISVALKTTHMFIFQHFFLFKTIDTQIDDADRSLNIEFMEHQHAQLEIYFITSFVNCGF